MNQGIFQACLDTLATYSHIYAELNNAAFPQTKESIALSQLENLISDIVDTLYEHKGQVA